MKKGTAKIVFTCFPMRNRGYFEWLYTGLQILEQRSVLALSHEGGSLDRFFRGHPRVFGKLLDRFPDSMGMLAPVDYFALAGRYERGGKSVTFAYDVTDAPFNYALAWLECADLYFKMQCPSDWDEAGFPLSTTVRVPYHPEVLRSRHKIRPTMSTGGITSTLNLKRNLGVLASDRQRIASRKDIRIFASFGSDRGPGPWEADRLPPAPHNFHNERSLVGLLGSGVGHPNEKRGELVRRLRSWNKADVDARIWNSRDPSIQGDAFEWNDYLVKVSESVFNVNISGFRRSAPFRIIDTLRMGSMVATDNLAVRWYRPFDPDLEVHPFGELGYEAGDRVNWTVAEHELSRLYDLADSRRNCGPDVLACFDEKWHPERLASYFVEECEKVLEGGVG
ncbi:MAG: hypothetical protein PHF70_02070 [Opitutales bacterium]|nr:hypothetical protein [Opitutales bacterium]